jgi:hypothetical protein
LIIHDRLARDARRRAGVNRMAEEPQGHQTRSIVTPMKSMTSSRPSMSSLGQSTVPVTTEKTPACEPPRSTGRRHPGPNATTDNIHHADARGSARLERPAPLGSPRGVVIQIAGRVFSWT